MSKRRRSKSNNLDSRLPTKRLCSEDASSNISVETVSFSDLDDGMVGTCILPFLGWKDKLSLSRTSRRCRAVFLSSTRVLPSMVVSQIPGSILDLFTGIDTLDLRSMNGWRGVPGHAMLCHLLRDRVRTLKLTDLACEDLLLTPFVKMTTLELRNCNFNGFRVTPLLSRFPGLTKLVINSTDILSRDGLYSLSSLEVLDMRSTHVHCSDLQSLTRLRRLCLNAANCVDSSSVSRLPPSITALKVQNVKENFSSGLHVLTNLETLVVKNCNDFGCSHVAKLPKLVTVKQVECARADRSLTNVLENYSLKELYISCTGGFRLDEVVSYPNLTFLSIDTDMIIGAEKIARLSHLNELHLRLSHYRSYRFLDDVLLSLRHLKRFTLSECTLLEPRARGGVEILKTDGYLRDLSVLQCDRSYHKSRGDKSDGSYTELIYDILTASEYPDPPSLLSDKFLRCLDDASAEVIGELLKGQFVYSASARGIELSLRLWSKWY